MEDHSETLNRIREAVRSQDETELEAIVGEVATFNFKNPVAEGETFPEDVFVLILNLLRQQAFLEMKGSSNLLLLFEYDWSTLSEDQRSRLLETLGNSFDRFHDSLSQFVITELLGEYYCDNGAFKILTELERTEVEVARALIPHGYEHLVKGTDDLSLREKAMARLLSMKNDPSETVRNEVEEALRHLS